MRLFHRPLLIAGLKVTSHPKLSLLIASIVLVACVGAAIWKLEISTEQNKLFDPDVPFFRDYLAFSKNFPENEALYVLIEPVPGAPRPKQMPPPVPRWTAIADAIADRLRAMPDYVRAVDAKVPIDKLGSQGLLFDDPPRVRQAFEDIKHFSALAKLWAEQPTLLTRVMGSTPIERFLTPARPIHVTAGLSYRF